MAGYGITAHMPDGVQLLILRPFCQRQPLQGSLSGRQRFNAVSEAADSGNEKDIFSWNTNLSSFTYDTQRYNDVKKPTSGDKINA